MTNRGWARPEPGAEPETPGMTGVLITDMPAARPAIARRPRKPIRGVPSPSPDPGEDYRPGGGTWRPA
jgi:hypothetical protein